MVSGLLLGDFPGFGHKLVWSMYSRVWVSLSVCVYYVSNDYNIAQISVEYLMITCERDYCLHIYLTLTCERSDYLWQHVVFNFPVMLIISFIVQGTILKYSNSSRICCHCILVKKVEIVLSAFWVDNSMVLVYQSFETGLVFIFCFRNPLPECQRIVKVDVRINDEAWEIQKRRWESNKNWSVPHSSLRMVSWKTISHHQDTNTCNLQTSALINQLEKKHKSRHASTRTATHRMLTNSSIQ